MESTMAKVQGYPMTYYTPFGQFTFRDEGELGAHIATCPHPKAETWRFCNVCNHSSLKDVEHCHRCYTVVGWRKNEVSG